MLSAASQAAPPGARSSRVSSGNKNQPAGLPRFRGCLNTQTIDRAIEPHGQDQKRPHISNKGTRNPPPHTRGVGHPWNADIMDNGGDRPTHTDQLPHSPRPTHLPMHTPALLRQNRHTENATKNDPTNPLIHPLHRRLNTQNTVQTPQPSHKPPNNTLQNTTTPHHPAKTAPENTQNPPPATQTTQKAQNNREQQKPKPHTTP